MNYIPQELGRSTHFEMRFQESFNYGILVEEGMDEGYTQIPPMILQPFVENSIKHGLLHKAGEKILRIHFRETPEYDYVICTITDNGIGRKKSAELNKVTRHNHNSFSIEAIQKRLDLMRQEKTGRLSITYTDLVDENGLASGTTVSIVIPTFII
jgi:two-component system LytT family sensor kinase